MSLMNILTTAQVFSTLKYSRDKYQTGKSQVPGLMVHLLRLIFCIIVLVLTNTHVFISNIDVTGYYLRLNPTANYRIDRVCISVNPS